MKTDGEVIKMMVRNYLTTPLEDVDKIHDGIGTAQHVSLFTREDFKTNIRFLNYTVLPAGVTIGLHPHGEDEELYMVLEGDGVMTVNGETQRVTSGDVIVNPPFGSHGIVNDSDKDMKLLVMEVYK